MITKTSRLAAILASAAAFSMSASPALARDWGWGGGWGGHRHHDDGIDAGDVLAGILIIGGIAAIASAASSGSKQRRQAPPPPPEPQYDRGYAGSDSRPQWQADTSIDSVVNRCFDEVSRGSTRADTVDTVSRDGDGWRVAGRTANGSSFACSVDRDGRVRNVNIDGQAR